MTADGGHLVAVDFVAVTTVAVVDQDAAQVDHAAMALAVAGAAPR